MAGLLERINDPKDLRALPRELLPQVASEIRQVIIDKVSKTGGHFGGPLGAVELVIALHYVFNTPEDQLVWDVGYQAYAHKILTGRRDRFGSLRQWGGISGFPHREESPYDLFTIGHGGTSISTALGLARARDHQGKGHKVVAIIGDGSLPEGMALEGLNHAGHLKSDFLVILNDNRMAIAPAVGALTACFNRIITDPLYNRVRKEVERTMCRVPRFGYRLLRAAKRLEESLKSLLVPGIIFEELGFRYFGPVDGHNLDQMIRTFRQMKNLPGPKLLHLITVKGKGYPPAEADQWKYHGVTPFDPATGEFIKKPSPETFTQRFGKTMIRAAQSDPKVMAITAAMPDGTGLVEYAKALPGQFYDVGMCEQHAVAFAAGLARGGFKPVAAIYSTFLQRAYDQVIHDVCIQNLPVVFAMDRAGLVGDDGITHHGVFDIAYLSALPRFVLMAPKDLEEFEAMLEFALAYPGPIGVRYPRGGVLRFHPEMPREAGLSLPVESAPIQLGKAEVLARGTDLAIIALGSMVVPALEARGLLEGKGVSATVVNARFAKPLDLELFAALAKEHRAVVTVEEGVIRGGFGASLLEQMEGLRNGLRARVLGIPDRFFEHGKREILLQQAGLTPEGMVEAALELLERSSVYAR
ncbi:MAG: 1-deoxy-D-xylulose-5-phosphate synthase [Candidatus Omnitrophica bacterium]|nr:1-deoxy-D-xylulose-5-phosphate synthase [Candidatus Omnitrophota bacterium]